MMRMKVKSGLPILWLDEISSIGRPKRFEYVAFAEDSILYHLLDQIFV